MTTGAPIYLVSACSTGEEFVAAFRRYADRGSLFVPIAEPIPAGRRGRFALALTGGAVILEGDGEVISSSKTPSVLHGRVGMTIRFVDLDDASKTVLIELEKARLVAKPPAPSGTPRIAELPAEPRPKPPATSARIDASIALAECVAIGDIEALAQTGGPPKAGPKFVVPTVPPLGSPRPKTPSTPPELRPRTPSGAMPVVKPGDRPRTPSVPPPMPALSPLPKSPSGPTQLPKPEVGAFSATMPAVSIADLQRPATAKRDLAAALASAGTEIAKQANVTPTEMSAVPPPGAPAKIMAAVSLTPTEMAAVPPPVTAPIQAARPPREDPTVPSPVRVAAAARREDPTPAKPVPAVRPDLSTKESLLTTVRDARPPVFDPSTKDALLTTQRGTAAPNPPIVAAPKPPTPELELDEPTDLTTVPPVPVMDARETRKTSMGIAVTPGGALVLPAITATPGSTTAVEPVPVEAAPVEIEDIDTSVTEQPSDVPPPAARKPNVEEATPSGDWTITPGDHGPKLEPRAVVGKDTEPGLQPVPQVEDAPIKAPAKRVTGDWTIQLDADSPDGWSEPSRLEIAKLPVEKPKPKKPKQAENPPELAPVARSIIIDSPAAPPPEPVTPSEEPKIQIDPTLMEAPIVDPDHGAEPAPPATLSALMPVAQSSPAISVEHMRLATPVPGSMSPVFEVARPTPIPPTRNTPLPIAVAGVPVMPPSGAYPAPADAVALPPGGFAPPAIARNVTDGGVGFFRESGDLPHLAGSGSFPVGDSTSLVEAGKRRRLIVIAISAGVAVAIGIVLVIALASGGNKPDEAAAVAAPVDAALATTGSGSGDRVAVTPPKDAAEVPSRVEDAAEVPPPPAVCRVEVTSAPSGAEVYKQGEKASLGVTPASLALPCDGELRLVVRKARFAAATRAVTPTEAGAKLRVTLQRLMFSVKVSSRPPGASISVNGKSVAVTPTTMKLPAFETSTVTFKKNGYKVESQKVTPRQNNQTVHAQLKRKR